MSKNFDETVHLQSEKRQEWIRKRKGERLQEEIAEDTNSAPCLCSSSTTSFLGRNKCLGTHCGLIEQEEKEDRSCQRNRSRRRDGGEDRVARAEREPDRKREEKWQTCWCCRDSKELAQWHRLHLKNLSTLGLLRRKDIATKRAVGKYAGVTLAKKKRNRTVCPEYQIMRGEKVKVSGSRTLEREGRSEQEHGEERVDSTVKEGTLQGGEVKQTRRASLGKVKGSISG